MAVITQVRKEFDGDDVQLSEFMTHTKNYGAGQSEASGERLIPKVVV